MPTILSGLMLVPIALGVTLRSAGGRPTAAPPWFGANFELDSGLGPAAATPGEKPRFGDLDEDGDVDLSDLAALLSVYGTICP